MQFGSHFSVKPQLVSERKAPKYQAPIQQIPMYQAPIQMPMYQAPVQQSVSMQQISFQGWKDYTLKAVTNDQYDAYGSLCSLDNTLEGALHEVTKKVLGKHKSGKPQCFVIFNCKFSPQHPNSHLFSDFHFHNDVISLYSSCMSNKYGSMELVANTNLFSLLPNGNGSWILVANYCVDNSSNANDRRIESFRRGFNDLVKKYGGPIKNEGERIYTKSGYPYRIYSQGGTDLFAVSIHHQVNTKWTPHINIVSSVDIEKYNQPLYASIQASTNPLQTLMQYIRPESLPNYHCFGKITFHSQLAYSL